MSSKFITFPIQKTKNNPCCDNMNISTSLDGNREQFCNNCNWSWNVKELENNINCCNKPWWFNNECKNCHKINK